MKPTEMKEKFVLLRAEGESFASIAKELGIAKSTCAAWDKEFASQIDDIKRESLRELCEAYGAVKEARIKRIGKTLQKIEGALDANSLEEMDPGKLMELQLKYMTALQAEYAGTKPMPAVADASPEGINAALADVLERLRKGDLPAENAQKEAGVLTQLLKSYEVTQAKATLDKLEAVLGGRESWM